MFFFSLPGLILLSAFISFLVLSFTEGLQQKGQEHFAAAICGAAFIFLIYLGYFNLALETLAAFAILGITVGVGLRMVFQYKR